MRMKVFTTEDIRTWDPCYDPNRYLPEDWSGTCLDLLEHSEIPPQDKLWVISREELIDVKTLRLLAVWCARQVQHLLKDGRSIKALDVAEQYANDEATTEELAAAGDAAWDARAARVAARAARVAARAARVAARAAAEDAAWDAAGVAEDAAWAARVAAGVAAGAAAEDAAEDAAGAAAWAAARVAAWAAGDAQIKQLIKMLKEREVE